MRFIVFVCLIFVQACQWDTLGFKKKKLNGACAPLDKVSIFDYPPLKNNQNVNALFNFLEKEHGFNANVLMYNNGQSYVRCMGFEDIGKQTLLTTNSQFQIASMSKPFTAVAIIQLAMQNKLKLSDTVGKYISQFPYYGVTLNHLLSHTSGIPEYMAIGDLVWHDSLGHMTNKEAMKLFYKKVPAYFKPGTRHDYCNSNYIILADIVEKVSKLNFPAYMQKYVFCPLSMDSTFIFKATDSIQKLNVKGHYGNGNYIADHYLNGVYGDKNIWSTVNDLFRFYKGIFNVKFMPKAWREYMFTTLVEKARGKSKYARGWRKQVIENDTWIYHTGWWKGFRTNLLFNSTKEACFVILSNKLKGGVLKTDIITALFKNDGPEAIIRYYKDSINNHNLDTFAESNKEIILRKKWLLLDTNSE